MSDVQIVNRTAEVGYVIHPDYQGRGCMTSALATAIRELFALGYQEVLAGAFQENTASIHVMEHVGMQQIPKTDEIEYRGKSHRCAYFSIKKQE